MPYIDPDKRELLEDGIKLLQVRLGHYSKQEQTGQLNYIFTRLLIGYVGKSPRYNLINSALGVLSAVGLELYRRLASPYEDQKASDNGDVYE